LAGITRPKLAVFSPGGTIASVRGADGAASPNLSAAELIAAVPQLADVADIEAARFSQVASSELTIADVIALAERIGEAMANGAAGAVVTQGTNTLEETSFVMDLLWDRDEPIALTGAMRHPGLAGADGPANLLASAVVAASPLARALGALVVFNDEVHLPLFVRKTHTTNPATFRSPLTGPIGWIVENRLRIALRPAVRHHIAVRHVPGRTPPPVALMKVALGDDGRLLSAVDSLGYRGCVIEATGAGHVPRAMVEPLSELAKKMPVVLTSRTGAGELLRNTYGFPGSETDLLHRGLIHGGVLDGLKARLLLTLLLIAEADNQRIIEAFAAIGVPGNGQAFRMV
jgi:L-asparaginase